jgi:hypothetical protein
MSSSLDPLVLGVFAVESPLVQLSVSSDWTVLLPTVFPESFVFMVSLPTVSWETSPTCPCSRSSECELADVLVLTCDDGSVHLISRWSHWSADVRSQRSKHGVVQQMDRS